jgi:transposase
MIRVDAAWFALEPLDMRAGVDTALAPFVSVFGEARAHHAYLFVNKRANRMKVLVHDGFGLRLCARRLYEGCFIRAGIAQERGPLSHEQLQAIVVGGRGNDSMRARRYACCEKKSCAKYVDRIVNVAASKSMELPREWAQMDAEQLRDLTATLYGQLAEREAQLATSNEELKRRQLKIDQLTHEMATLKRWRYGRHSEQLDAVQRSLLDESIDADLEAISLEIDVLRERPSSAPKSQPRRMALPGRFPGREIRHEPEDTQCSCGCSLERIGENVSEKLDYTPGVFEVERHVRGKWVCRSCERLIQAPVPAHIIDKGIPTAGLLAQVLIAKYLDHLPLYRQEAIFGRAGLALPRSTLAQWVGACGIKLQPLVDALKALLLTRAVLHADETPVPMLKPGLGRTHRAYLWSYSSSEYDELPAVVYDFADSRSGLHARQFLGSWSRELVCDDYSGYKALFERGVIEISCMAHARRKFHELYVNDRSDVAEEALRRFAALYEIERGGRERRFHADGRQQLRQQRSKPIAEALRQWLVRQRGEVPDGSASAKAIEYSLGAGQP